MAQNFKRMKLRLAPVMASVAALTALAAVPTGASADTTSSGTPTSSATPSSASTSASTSTSTSTSSSTSTSASASTDPTAKQLTLGYGCMLLGKTVPVTLTWTVPKNLVEAAETPLPAGRTLGQVVGGTVRLGLTVRLSTTAITRLKLVDQKTVGGKFSTQLGFGPSSQHTTYQPGVRKLAPNSSGVQDLASSVDISKTLIRTRDSGAPQTIGLNAASSANTNLMIPGFLWSSCRVSNAKASRRLLTTTVDPAVINATVVQAQVKSVVLDGGGRPAAGTVTETMTGWAHHKKHTVTVHGTLDKGSYTHSFRKTMEGLGVISAKVQIAFAGRTHTVSIHT